MVVNDYAILGFRVEMLDIFLLKLVKEDNIETLTGHFRTRSSS